MKKKNFDRAQIFLLFRSLKTTRKNRTSPNAGPIKKFFLQNLNILTKKYYKFQNRSQQKSQSCVTLNCHKNNAIAYEFIAIQLIPVFYHQGFFWFDYTLQDPY
jgi:hypothetical protein